jgi:hypothetical protein
MKGAERGLLKARYVVIGSKQLPAYDFEKMFAPTMSKE